MNSEHLRIHVIDPVISKLGWHSLAATELLLGTCAAESAMGESLVQIGGPAKGIYQMEPATHSDIWVHWLQYQPEPVRDIIRQMAGLYSYAGAQHPNSNELIGNLFYATAMCRAHYRRRPEPLPKAGDLDGLADYWKTHYNTVKGKGTVEHFKTSYNQLVQAW